jgi:hypothetical protein
MKYTKSTTRTGFVGYLNIINIIDNKHENFETFCNYYGLHNINNLCFILYDKINYFVKLYTLLFINKSYNKSIKIPNGMNFYDIHNLKINMIKLINDLIIKNNNDKIIIIDDVDKKSSEINQCHLEIQDTVKDNQNIKKNKVIIDNVNKIEKDILLQIPILHIPCKKLEEILKKKEFNYETINKHYNKCRECEIINNNNFQLELIDNINYKIISNINELDKILYYYNHPNEKFNISSQIFKDCGYDLNKINLIYCDTCEELYDNCLFFI